MKKQAIFTLVMAVTILAVLPASADVGDVGLMFDPNGGWQSIGLSGGGAMFNPAVSPIDPNLIMVNCDMGDAFLSHNGGYNWTMIHHEQLTSNTVCQAAFHPKDINIIYAARGRTVKVTHDRGRTWNQIADIGSSLQGQIVIDPEDPNLMLLGAGDAVWRSDDAGHNWTQVTGPNGEVIGFHFDMTSPVANRICFAATVNGVWRSDDRGLNWVDKSGGLPWNIVQGFAGGSNADTSTVILYCAILSQDSGGFQGGVYKSTDRGDTWTSAMGAGINTEIGEHPPYAMGDIAQYYHTLTTNVDPNIVYTYNSSTGFNPPYHPTVYRSADAGANWTAVFYQDPRFTGQYNVEYNYHTAYLGQAWQSVPHGAAIAPSNPDLVLHTDNEMCYITHNGGVSWFNGQTRPVPGSGNPPTTFRNTGLVVTAAWHYYIDPFQSNRHYILYADISFARSLGAGQTWKWGGAAVPWFNSTYELAFDPDTPGKIWGAFSNLHDVPNANTIIGEAPSRPGGIGISYDYGATWAKSNTGLPDAPACGVIVDPTTPVGSRTLYATVYGYGVYKSTNDGAGWTLKSNGLGSATNMRAYSVRLHDDGTLFCLITAMYTGGSFDPDGVGLYKSTDGAENWVQINDELLWPKEFAVDPEDSNTIYIGAADAQNNQGGLWRTRNGGTTWGKIARMGTYHFGAYLHPSRPGYIYLTLGDWQQPDLSALWLSKDYGTTWQPFLKLPFADSLNVTFDPADPDIIYVATLGGSVFKGRYKPHVDDYLDYLAILASKWLEQDCDGSNNCDGTDLNLSSKVNLEDFAVLAMHWLENTEEPDYLLLDGFEFYNSKDTGDNPLWDTWDPTGATSTWYDISFAPTHTGSKSMEIWSDNSISPYYCGASRTDAAQDYTCSGATESLSLWYYGAANIVEIYVRLIDDQAEEAVVLYSDAWDTGDLQLTQWQQWDIDLQYFIDDNPSFDMTNVETLEVGVGDCVNPQPVGFGPVYFDDIWLIQQ